MNLGKVGILGDSYSTFGGYVPKDYYVYYDTDAGEKYGFVNDVNKTWWMKVVRETDSTLVINSSYSGSCVCNYDYQRDEDCTKASFVTRMQNDLGADVNLDTIFVYGCTNDYWRKAVRGELKYDGHTKEQLNTLYPAIGYVLGFLKANHPTARIIFITNPFFDQDLTTTIQTACDHYGAQHLHLSDFCRIEGHPTEAGMQEIAKQVMAFLKNNN